MNNTSLPLQRRQSLIRMWDVFLSEASITQDEACSMTDIEFGEILESHIQEAQMRGKFIEMRQGLAHVADSEVCY